MPDVQVPARRRLHTGGEPAAGDPVLFETDLRDLLTVEVDVRFRRAKHRLLRRGLPGTTFLLFVERRRAGRVVEDAGSGLGVVLEAIGGDPVFRAGEHHAAGRDHGVGFGEDLDLVGRQRIIAAVDFHLARQLEVILFDLLEDLLPRRPASTDVLGGGRPHRAEDHHSRDQRAEGDNSDQMEGRPHRRQTIPRAGRMCRQAWHGQRAATIPRRFAERQRVKAPHSGS